MTPKPPTQENIIKPLLCVVVLCASLQGCAVASATAGVERLEFAGLFATDDRRLT